MDTHILAVGTSRENRVIMQAALTSHELSFAEDGKQALECIAKLSDLVLILIDATGDTLDALLLLHAIEQNPRYAVMLIAHSGDSDSILHPPLTAAVVSKQVAQVLQKDRSKLLNEQAFLFNAIFWQAPMGISISHGIGPIDGPINEVFRVNPRFEEITGWTSEELKSLGWAAITHPDDLEADLEQFRRLQAGEISSYSLQKRYIKPDGSAVWVSMVVASLQIQSNHSYSHICLVQDISERKEAEQRLAESERSKSMLLSHLPGLAYRTKYDHDWTVLYVSNGCKALTGYENESLLHNRDICFNDLIVPSYQQGIRAEWARVLPLHQTFTYEYEIIKADGQRCWVWETGQGLYGQHDEVLELEGIILDISDRKKIEHELMFLNEHDIWTGLYNRRYLEQLLFSDADLHPSLKRAVLAVNLSALHTSSMTYGFQYTQEIIKKVSSSLLVLCSDQCLLCKTHEYRFSFYVKDYRDKEDLIAFCKRISSLLETFLIIEGINWGIGIVEIGKGTTKDVEQLLRNALVASEKALHQLHDDSSYCFFDKAMEEELYREEVITAELSRIAAGEGNGSLFLNYQPILDLGTNRIVGFEALARLQIPSLGLIPPLQFIPITEKTKLIIPLGDSIILQALRFLNTVQSLGYSDIFLSINISAIQLLKHDFNANLLRMIKAMQVDPHSICLEITESVFASNYQDINRVLGQLQSLGIQIAIDDFGTGYSSLARERELNINCLKIDKSFIDKLMTLSEEQAITGDIISMAHKLGHCVVAEGIEHEKQLQYLRKFNCDKIQGYLISRPVDDKAALALLKAQT
ncbi:MAG: EAL domain-containing protein [Sphaerochaeta sp.]|uniref:EAL domain-containing protein n=1 Tax=Sphaerochaeta sp. TaxID=1972642 RepID=UPI002A371475|nr:EAL domain-containing protein [Sphaerochaeta sp.]MDX9825609.1 EAL domain-containing protein [Sphaerochaeta sp.]